MTITYDDFKKVDIRVGTIIEVTDFERARNPSYRLKIDFGPELGIKQSSGQFKTQYAPGDLMNTQCLAVVNFEPKNIAGFLSEVLVLGVDRPDGGGVVILRPAEPVAPGTRMY